MALNLTTSQHELIRDVIVSKSLKTAQMAEVAGCSPRSINIIAMIIVNSSLLLFYQCQDSLTLKGNIWRQRVGY
jgi:hypothetical protein